MSGALAKVRYAVGLCLDHDRRRVLLVRKTRPTHLADRLNAIGGHVEPMDRDDLSAMRREWAEEVGGVVTTPWRQLATLSLPAADVVVFVATADSGALARKHLAFNDAGERLELVRVDQMEREAVVSDVRWLVPLATHQPATYTPFTAIEEKSGAAG